MTYGLLLTLIAACLAQLAFTYGRAYWLLLWPAASFLIVAAAYFFAWPGVFGKRPDGTLSLGPRILLAPFLLYAWIVWRIARRVRREPAMNEVEPRLWVGRRPCAHELPATITLVVDLTAEFSAARGIRARAEYVTAPTLDGSAPHVDAIERLVKLIREHQGHVYVHCASGHGRSATVAAACLIDRGVVDRPDQAVAHLRQTRPSVHLNRAQRKLLQRMYGDGMA